MTNPYKLFAAPYGTTVVLPRSSACKMLLALRAINTSRAHAASWAQTPELARLIRTLERAVPDRKKKP